VLTSLSKYLTSSFGHSLKVKYLNQENKKFCVDGVHLKLLQNIILKGSNEIIIKLLLV